MRLFLSVISFLASLLVPGLAAAGMLSAPGPNPNWTDMQQFEWYLGYMATSARLCGAYDDASRLHKLARMTPYGETGLGAVTGDGFAGPVCGGIVNDAKDLVADETRIREYIEAAYGCRGEGCYGQKLSSWKFHDCGNSLKSHFAILGIDYGDIRAVTMIDPAKTGSDAAHQARVRFHSCTGSLYIDLTDQCIMAHSQTRGDCTIAGVDAY